MSPTQAIKMHCKECCCGSAFEVKMCPVSSCYLYPFRMGHNPNVPKREMTEEQKAIYRANLQKARAAKEANAVLLENVTN